MSARSTLCIIVIVLLALVISTVPTHPAVPSSGNGTAFAADSLTPRWIIRLHAPPLTQAPGVAPEFAIQAAPPDSKLQLDTPAAQQYRQTLYEQQRATFQTIQRLVPSAEIHQYYTILFNGLSVALPGSSKAAIRQIRSLPEVAELYTEHHYAPAMYKSVPQINAEALWNNPSIGGQANAGEGIKIAILDTGIQVSNPFFNPEGFTYPPGYPKGETDYTTPKIIVARSYFRPDLPPSPGNETPEPGPNEDGHGTHVAGIAAGVANTTATIDGQSYTLSGVAPRAYLMNYKLFYEYESDLVYSGGGFTTEFLAALEDAVADGADIINGSFGSTAFLSSGFDPATLAVEAAVDAGVTVIFATGNSGPDKSTIGAPDDSPKVITVGAVTSGKAPPGDIVDDFEIDVIPDMVFEFSSVGPTFDDRLKPDLLAPGVNILSSDAGSNAFPIANYSFGVRSGTSHAAPHVSGAAALLKQIYPHWSPANIKSALMSTAVPNIWVDEAGSVAASVLERGAGRIDLEHAANPGLLFNPPSLSFGSLEPTPGQPATAELSVSVRNATDTPQTYRVGSRPLNGSNFTITVSPPEVNLGASEAATIVVTIDIPGGALPGDYEGTIELNGPQSLHLPLWARLLPTEQRATVLLIDNDSSSFPAEDREFANYAPYYTSALDQLGISYTYLDVDAIAAEEQRFQVVPDISELQTYPLVIWFTGDNNLAYEERDDFTPLTEADQNTLTAYLQSGGRLIATGQNLAEASDNDPQEDPRYDRSRFYHDYLGAYFWQDDVYEGSATSDRSAVGTTMQPWLSSITIDLSNPANDGKQPGVDTGAGNQNSVDEVVTNYTDPRWPDEQTTEIVQALREGVGSERFIALNRSSSATLEQPTLDQALPYRTTYLSFGLEGVRNDTGQTSRTDLLQALINWSLDFSTVTITGTSTLSQSTQVATVRANAQSSTGASFVAYRWDFGDGSAILETSVPEATHTYTTPGSYTVRGEATNSWGHRTVASTIVEAPDGAPVPAPPDEERAPGDTTPVPHDALTFPETGYTLQGRFLEFWQTHGGLAVFGYPISPQSTTEPISQQFERTRFEYHPQNEPPYDVLLGHLGIEALEAQKRDWHTFATVADATDDCLYFAETQHSVCGAFRAYWESHGLEFDGAAGTSYAESLALFGLPISEPQEEEIDGTMLTVQWFERARFEEHPQNEPPFNVLLGRLGAAGE